MNPPPHCSWACSAYSSDDVHAVLDPDTAIQTQRDAFLALAAGTTTMPPKVFVPDGDGDAAAFFYMARLDATTGMVSKFGSVHPANAARGLPSLAALITLLDPVTGQPVAIMDGAAITALRTSAASAVAFDVLGRPDAARLAVIGSGVQAVNHVRSVARVRALESVRMWSTNHAQCQEAAASLSGELQLDVESASSAQDAVAGATLVALCTLSTTPVIDAVWLAPGATIVSIGSFEPHRCEVDDATMKMASHVVVDHLDTALAHAGPIMRGLERGLFVRHAITELGDHLRSGGLVERDSSDVVLYNSTGVAVQDARAAWTVHERARQLGIGTTVAF